MSRCMAEPASCVKRSAGSHGAERRSECDSEFGGTVGFRIVGVRRLTLSTSKQNSNKRRRQKTPSILLQAPPGLYIGPHRRRRRSCVHRSIVVSAGFLVIPKADLEVQEQSVDEPLPLAARHALELLADSAGTAGERPALGAGAWPRASVVWCVFRCIFRLSQRENPFVCRPHVGSGPACDWWCMSIGRLFFHWF